jgi:hypothetical protein
MMKRCGWRRTLVLALAVAAFAVTPTLRAQPPGVGSIFPPGGRAGTTVDVRLTGMDWTPDVRFLLHDPRVKLEVVGPPGKILFHEPPYWIGLKSKINDPPITREVHARLVIPADVPAGPIRWRVVNANGASNTGIFLVSHDNEVIEDEARKQPQEFSVPATISGRLRRIEEVDQYRFRCDRAGLLSCELTARRLGSNLYGVIEVHDAQGRRVAEGVDTDGIDPVVTFVGEKDQSYTISLRDVDYRGFRSLTYRLSVFAGPRVLAALPAAGRRGETREIEFVGIGVASGQAKLESITRKVTFPQTSDRSSFDYVLETAAGKAKAFPLFLSDLPETVAPDVGGEPLALSIPQAVTGRLGLRGGKAQFSFEGKKGEAFRIGAEARRLGSPLDLALAVLDPGGKEIASNDDIPGSTDAQHSVKLPADGAYQIVLTDVAGMEPAPASIYRLVLERQAEDFRLETLPLLNLPIGDKANLAVTVVREAGFKEPVQISVSGLPAGVGVPDKLVVAPNATSLVIPFTCTKSAAVNAAFVTIEGSAKLGDKTVTRRATVPLAGDLVMWNPAAHRHPVVLLATTLQAPFSVKCIEGDGTRRVHRGATHLAELVIERKDGFTGPIVLDAAATQSRHSQGIRGAAFTIRPDTDKVYYPVFLPEHVETTTTRRLALMAMAQVPDGAGKPHFVLSPMKGQITMIIEGALLKLAHEAEDLAVPAGESFTVPLRLVRSIKLTAPARVELLIPEELAGLVHAEPLNLSAKQTAADWKITTQASARLRGRFVLPARATAMRDGHPVISETDIEVEFLPTAVERPRR